MRYFAKLGYRYTEEQKDSEGRPNGIYKEIYIERPYKAEVMSSGYQNQQGEGINDDYKITNKFSVLACDAFTLSHLNSIIWIEYLNVKWKVTSVDIQRPRLIISIGGEYNGVEQE